MGKIIFDEGIPIYIQIMKKIKQQVISGIWKPGERIPSVRDFSSSFGVNPNTMQRALLDLERAGLLFSERTTGRFVTEDREVIIEMKNSYAKEIVDNFVEQMRNLGYSREEIARLLWRKENE